MNLVSIFSIFMAAMSIWMLTFFIRSFSIEREIRRISDELRKKNMEYWQEGHEVIFSENEVDKIKDE